MLRMFLIFRSIGKKLLTSQSKIPTTIMTIRIDNNGIIKFFKLDYKIDVSIFKTGLYFIKLQTNNGLRVATFIKE